jgi:hypothetical protein
MQRAGSAGVLKARRSFGEFSPRPSASSAFAKASADKEEEREKMQRAGSVGVFKARRSFGEFSPRPSASSAFARASADKQEEREGHRQFGSWVQYAIS